MKYHFKYFKDIRGGYWAECLELEGTRTEGVNKKHLFKNMREALDLTLSEPPDSRLIFPPPNPRLKGRNVVAIEVDPSVAMAMTIRQLRLKNELTQVAMKQRLGIKHLSNYQRLEDPNRANPEWKTLLMIKKAFPEFRLDPLLA